MSRQECYACDQPAVGREHVPPLCLFPEARDSAPGSELRRQLITVPACDDHNLRKSKDDEYLMLIVPFHHRTNVVARQQVRTKVIRALTRRPKLKDKVFTPQVPVVLDGQPTGAVLLDTERFLRISDLIVRGIHYHHAGKAKLRGEVKVYTLATDSFDPEVQSAHNGIRVAASALFDQRGACGANPDVFFYQAAVRSSGDSAVLRLTFYGGFEILAIWENPVPSFCAT
jgi:hypothetical protein